MRGMIPIMANYYFDFLGKVMPNIVLWRLFVAASMAFAMGVPAQATDVAAAPRELHWLAQLQQQIAVLPEYQAQEARLQAVAAATTGADKPLYNPELALSYLNGDDNSYSMALSQTIDWHDKGAAAAAFARQEQAIAVSDVALQRSHLYGEVLQQLVARLLAQKALNFADTRVTLGEQQLAIAAQRLHAGELSQVEWQMLRLEQANTVAERVLAEQQLTDAETALLGRFGQQKLAFTAFIDRLRPQDAPVAPRLPAMQRAFMQYGLAQLGVAQARAQSGADPSVSLTAEREGQDNKLGIGISVPLQLRNDYRDSITAAMAQVSAAEADYQAQERALNQQQQQFDYRLPKLLQSWQQWQALVADASNEAAELLDQRWRNGDLSSSDYLLSRRQLVESFQAGIRLEQAIYQQWLSWMAASGQLPMALAQLQSSPRSPAQDVTP